MSPTFTITTTKQPPKAITPKWYGARLRCGALTGRLSHREGWWVRLAIATASQAESQREMVNGEVYGFFRTRRNLTVAAEQFNGEIWLSLDRGENVLMALPIDLGRAFAANLEDALCVPHFGR